MGIIQWILMDTSPLVLLFMYNILCYIIISLSQICPVEAVSLLYLFDMAHHSLSTSLLSGTRGSGLVLHFLLPIHKISHFSRKS